MDAKEWAEKVEAFLEENQELADDPTLGQSASQRLLLDTTNLLVPLMNDLTELLNQQEEAANKLTDAINDPRCSAGKVHRREKEYERLKAESEELKHWQDELEVLRAEAHDLYMARADEAPPRHWDTHELTDEELENMTDSPIAERPASPGKTFWQRLFR